MESNPPDTSQLWFLLLLASLATYVWRWSGVFIATRIEADSTALKWLTCVAYGMLAGLISRIFILPVGILGQTELLDRMLALGFGLIIFFILKRNITAGTLISTALFIALTTARHFSII